MLLQGCCDGGKDRVGAEEVGGVSAGVGRPLLRPGHSADRILEVSSVVQEGIPLHFLGREP